MSRVERSCPTSVRPLKEPAPFESSREGSVEADAIFVFRQGQQKSSFVAWTEIACERVHPQSPARLCPPFVSTSPSRGVRQQVPPPNIATTTKRKRVPLHANIGMLYFSLRVVLCCILLQHCVAPVEGVELESLARCRVGALGGPHEGQLCAGKHKRLGGSRVEGREAGGRRTKV